MKKVVADTRYSTIKVLIESGHIKSFRQIFDFIPKTVVYRDLAVNFNRFSRAILDPSAFTIRELIALAEMFDVDAKKMIDMAYQQALTVKKSRQKLKQW